MNRINCRVYFTLFSVWASAVCAQAATPQPQPVLVGLPTRTTLHQGWNETQSALVVPFTNVGPSEVKILGVQTTGGLYVQDFPKKIAAGGTENFKLLYLGKPQIENTIDLVRIHTDQGERSIEVVHQQDDAVKFSAHEVKWKVGDPAVTQDVSLKVTPNTVKIVSVKASGDHKAELVKDGANDFRVRITPSTTATSKRFTVMVVTDPALPGKSTMIAGTVERND